MAHSYGKTEYSQKQARTREILYFIFAAVILLAAGFYVDRYIHIKALYTDDLYTWSCYGEQSLGEFAFPFRTSSRFRPVYWMATFIEMMIIRTHISLFVPVNIILNVGIALLLVVFSRRLTKSYIIPIIAGMMFLFSHFAYYQIGQALGLLETMAQFMALMILYYLYRYIEVDSPAESNKWFVRALIMYFLLAFTHERYVGLLPLFYLVLIFSSSKKIIQWISPALNFVIIFLIRRIMIGQALPAGTGGTEVTDTFSLSQALGFAINQVQYIFGVNIGPSYLSGITWADCSDLIHKLVYLSWIPIILTLLWYIVTVVREKLISKQLVCINLLFLGFIALCIGCSSVTIRVEMRWVYVSYSAALLYLSYMLGTIRYGSSSNHDIRSSATPSVASSATPSGTSSVASSATPSGTSSVASSVTSSATLSGASSEALNCSAASKAGCTAKRSVLALTALLFISYFVIMTPVEKYYRTYYKELYFWEDQERMNSLYDVTIGEYGTDGVLGKQVYIFDNTYKMTDFYGRTFFKVFDEQKTGQGTSIHFIDSTQELPQDADRDNSIVLIERPELRGYQDVTEETFSK